MFQNILTYFRESYDELVNKVTWPSWEDLQANLMAVIFGLLIISAIIYVMDNIIGIVLRTLIY